MDPVLKEFLRSRQWERAFTRENTECGLALVANEPILPNLRIEDNVTRISTHAEVPDHGGLFHAEVTADKDPKLGRVTLRSGCSCGARLFCAHRYALLFSATHWLEENSWTVPPPEDEAATEWLALLEGLARREPPPEVTSLCYGLSVHDELGPLVLAYARPPGQGAPPLARAGLETAATTSPLARALLDLPGVDVPGWPLEAARSLGGDGSSSLLGRLLDTGRLYLVPGPRGGTPKALSPGHPVRISPGWDETDDGKVEPVLVLEDVRFQPIVLDFPWCLDPVAGTIHPHAGKTSAGLHALWVQGPRLSLEQGLAATAAMRHLDLEEPVPSPAGIEHIHPETMRPVLRIRRLRPRDWPDGRLPPAGALVGVPVFRYGEGMELGVAAEDEDAATGRVFHSGGLHVIHRMVEAEMLALGQLDHCHLSPIESWIPFAGPVPSVFRGARAPDSLPEPEAVAWAVWKAGPDADALRQAGWEIEDAPDPGVKVLESARETMRLDPWNNEGIDWFAFDLGVEAEGERVSLLPALAAAMLTHGDALLAIEPGEEDHLLLPVEGDESRVIRFPFRRFVVVARQVVEWFGGIPKPGARLHPMHAAEMAATLGETSTLHGPDAASAERLRQTGRALRGGPGGSVAPNPSGLRAELRPYQHEGFQWLQFLARHDLHGLLADDMGLGKTLQTIAHLTAEVESGRADGRPSLVVAPTSVTTNWKNELRKFAPGLRVLMLTGPRRHRYYESLTDADVVITSYPLLQRDADTLADRAFHTVVLDEAQWIKNPGTRAAKAAFALKARHRLALSGTPMENHLGELWSLFRFLMPGLLGSADEFRRFYRSPIEKSGDTRRQQALNRRVGPLILRRTKDKVAADLPPRTEVEHAIELLPAQADLYESVRATLDARVQEAIASQGLDRARILVLDAMLKLRQICCHPALLETSAAMGAGSAKLDHLIGMLLELIPAGRRVLVFSQFTSMLARIAERLEEEGVEYLELTGATKDRESLVRRFQEGHVPVFLISLKAGGAGLNLTAADTVIHYDPWWNPAVESQASDRAHRIGQTRPVFIHRLICQGTIEEKMRELKARKAGLVDALLAGSTTGFNLDQDTIRELFSPLVREEP